MMEILAPAGSAKKLEYAYAYGADAAYIGVQGFSLRANAENPTATDYSELSRIKGTKKLYGALNMFAFDDDVLRLQDFLYRSLSSGIVFPYDAWIVSDPGMARLLRSFLPDAELHLSTQANCINSETAKVYRDLGFSRIIPGRELSLAGIERMKKEVPEIDLEVFVHGAMCMAYSGRCYLSAELTGRSANRGDCAHTCRWDFKYYVEESERPGEYMPIREEEGHLALFSSRDLCMIDHLAALRNAGVDSLKIEGRMKSAYYVATVTRAYRKRLDALYEGLPDDAAKAYTQELYAVSHRDYSTGFFFPDSEPEKQAQGMYQSSHKFLGMLEKYETEDEAAFAHIPDKTWFHYKLALLNTLELGSLLEAISPDIPCIDLSGFLLSDDKGKQISRATHQKPAYLHSPIKLPDYALLRVPQ